MIFPESHRHQFPGYESAKGDTYGVFLIPSGSDVLLCIATDGECPGLTGTQWEHVSVSVRNRRGVPLSRCPTWEQMCVVKSAFWTDSECVMQLHPPRAEYVNLHKHCLHLWKPSHHPIPQPPSILVGPK